MDIVCFGQQNWDYCWTAKQQIMSRLAQRGHRVLYVDPDMEPPRSFTEARQALSPVRSGVGLREHAPNLHVLTYRLAPALGWRMSHRRHPRVVAATAKRLGFQDPVAMTLLPERSSEMFAHLKPKGRVYYPVDEITAFGGTTKEEAKRLRRLEEELVREVDLVLAVSPRLVRRLRLLNPRTHLVENAADVGHFAPERLNRTAPHPQVVNLPRPRLGFVGQIDERLDQELLLYLSRERPTWQIVLAGRVKKGVDVSRLEAVANIHLLGYQAYENLPGILREVDVCLVPYHLTPLTQSCWPLKTFEYLATGLPVVSTPLESLARLRDVVALAGTPPQFLHEVEQALLSSESARAARLDVARRNSWEERVTEIETHLREAQRIAQGRPEWRQTRVFGPSRLRTGREANLSLQELDEKPTAKFRLIYLASRIAGRLYYAARRIRWKWQGATGESAKVGKILVARTGRLGDTVAVLPMLSALRERYPEATIVLGVHRGFSAAWLLDTEHVVNEVRVFDHLKNPPDRKRAFRGIIGLFREGFDLVISGAAFSMQREALLSGAPDLVGLHEGYSFQNFNTRVLTFDPARHEAENNLALIEALGQWIEPDQRIPRLPEEDPSQQAALSAIHELGISGDFPFIAIHPGSQKPSRRWPLEFYRQLVAELLKRHEELQVVLTGSPEEHDLIDWLLNNLPEEFHDRITSAVGKTDLPGLVSLIKQAQVFVCNDTGTMHLARAAGAPLVALLGPENHERWGPHPQGDAPAIALRHLVPCAPCSRWDCEFLYCLRSLPVREALEAVEDLLAQSERTNGEEVFATQYRLTEQSWRSLAALGQALPLVTVVLFDDMQIAHQSYPHVQFLLVRESGKDSASLVIEEMPRHQPIKMMDSPQGSSGEKWQALLDAADGDLLLTGGTSGQWNEDTIGSLVAEHVRAGNPPTGEESRAAFFDPRQRACRIICVPRAVGGLTLVETSTRQTFSDTRSQSKLADEALPVLD